MKFLKSNKRFSFKYGDVSAFDLPHSVSYEQKGDSLTTTYLFENGLKVVNVAKKFGSFGAYEWLNYFENTGSDPTEIISELWDCDCVFDCEYQKKPSPTSQYPSKSSDMIIINPKGSNVDEFDFYFHIDESSASKKMFLFEGMSKEFKNIGGKSSEGLAPFFNVYQNGKGILFGIGWSGQWNCKISREVDTVRIQTKIEDTHFRLYPGEKIRTSSIVIMPYESKILDAQNKWRRLLKECFSPALMSSQHMPSSMMNWGGVTRGGLIKRLDSLDEADINYEYFWVDAGWYGNATSFGFNAFDGDWGDHVGEWFACKENHPDGLMDLAAKIKEKNKKFLLWFEIERAIDGTILANEHPEWMLETLERPRKSRLVNLGDPNAYEYFLDMLTERISALDIKCYRHDMNIPPLLHWRKYDDPDRVGITEIKYITNLYRLWDALLERFPDLLIDNCASGGTRLDMEMIRRSVSLWRSDIQCYLNIAPEITQAHNVNFSLWLPYTATGTGTPHSEYRLRSAYSAGMAFEYTDDHKNDPVARENLKKYSNEYMLVRPYFLGDIYPITLATADNTTLSATQWDRPEHGDGMLQIFRRSCCPCTAASFELYKIDSSKSYSFTDIDTNESTVISGKELNEHGFNITMPSKGTAKIFIYKALD